MSHLTRAPRSGIGSKVLGAITRTSAAPSVVSAWIAERATRECKMSPTMATLRFSMGPL